MKEVKVIDIDLDLEKITNLLRGKQLKILLQDNSEIIFHSPFDDLISMTREEFTQVKRNLSYNAEVKILEFLSDITQKQEDKVYPRKIKKSNEKN